MELETCLHIELTNVSPWNPNSVHLGQLSSAIDVLDTNGPHIDTSDDGVILNTISQSLTSIKECLLQTMSSSRVIKQASLDHVQARHSYISND